MDVNGGPEGEAPPPFLTQPTPYSELFPEDNHNDNSDNNDNNDNVRSRPRACCYTCCCSSCHSDNNSNSNNKRTGRGGRRAGDRIISESEDDASHIAAINSPRPAHHDDSNKKSGCCLACCFGCCCRRGKKSSHHHSSSTTGQTARRSGCKRCCMSFTAFLFSHIGLCSLVVAYSIMGGFLFQWLESSDEIRERISMSNTRNTSVEKLWNMTKELNILYEVNWTAGADRILREFQLQVFESVKARGWDGRDEFSTDMQWSFAGSLLYSVTVITTIGYGHIAPKTEMGRLVTIFYALLGIPLTLLCLANIGSAFGNCFRFMYKHFCNCLVWLCCPSHFKKSKNKPKVKASKTGSKVKAGHSKRSRSNKEAVTDYEESRQALRAKHSSSDCPDVEKGGVTEVTEVTGVTGVTEVGGSDLGSSRPHKPGRASSPQKAGTPPKSFPTHEKLRSPTDQSPDDDATTTTPPPPTTQPKKPGQEEIRVPMFVSLLIIALYIFGGAVLFSQWEKDWDYLIGSYFCFITLSTIGFGDYVFGVGGDLANNEKMIICALYLVLGLSIIAMCFNLMQEEVRAKFRWLGLKVGIIEHNDNKGP